MAGYTKLHSGILDGSIWNEDVWTRVVWITFLAKSDSVGRILALPVNMARIANVPFSKFNKAIEVLSSPDPDSRTPDEEGRRIIPIQGGWQIVNYEKYRNMMDMEERKAYKREWDRKHRSSGHERAQKPQKQVKNPQSDTVRRSPTNPTQAEAEAKAKAIKEKLNKKKYLEFVLLTDDEYKKLCDRFGKSVADDYIERLNNYLGSKGKRYKSHYHTILNWSNKDGVNQKSGIPPIIVDSEGKTQRQRALEEIERMRNE